MKNTSARFAVVLAVVFATGFLFGRSHLLENKPAGGKLQLIERHSIPSKVRALAAAVQNPAENDASTSREIEELSRVLKDEDLPTVEAFALTPEGRDTGFSLARIFVDRGLFERAANVIVYYFLTEPDNREYTMWKWWEHHFSERAAYAEMSRQMKDALLLKFEHGEMPQNLVVAELFGKGAAEARLSAIQFRATIDPTRLAP